MDNIKRNYSGSLSKNRINMKWVIRAKIANDVNEWNGEHIFILVIFTLLHNPMRHFNNLYFELYITKNHKI